MNDFVTSKNCNQNIQNLDKQLTNCLKHSNIFIIDALDEMGRRLFHNELILYPNAGNNNDKWYLNNSQPECCSKRLIAMEKVFGIFLYQLEYFIYKVKVFGRTITNERECWPSKKNLSELLTTL
jgi:hypothetical protein